MVCKPAPPDIMFLPLTDVASLELDEIVSAHCETHEFIDSTLRSYLSFTARYKGVQQIGPYNERES